MEMQKLCKVFHFDMPEYVTLFAVERSDHIAGIFEQRLRQLRTSMNAQVRAWNTRLSAYDHVYYEAPYLQARDLEVVA